MSLDRLPAIIFDMDGVITDTEGLHAEAEKITCRRYGFDAPLAEWQKFKGKKAEEIFSYLLDVYGGGRRIPLGELVAFKTATYLRLARSGEIPTVPGSLDFIRWARGRFLKMGLATSSNGPIQRAVFERFGLDEFFDAVTTGDELIYGKPHPEAYLRAASKVGLPPGSCLVIEDSDNGIRAAVGAGCRVIGITTSFPRPVLIGAGAHLTVDDYDELKKMLAGPVPAV